MPQTASSSGNFVFVEFRYPDVVHSFGLQDADVLFAKNMAFSEKLFPAGAEDGGGEHSSSRLLYLDRLSFH